MADHPPPARVVWELTWRCTLRCTHCLVEGGPNDKVELDPAESLALCDALAALGTRTVTLTGGEPLLRPDWDVLARRLSDQGIRVVLSTNGHGLNAANLARAVAAGVRMAVLSLDGLAEAHDAVRRYPEARARRSSFAEVGDALRRLAETPITRAVITSVDAHNLADLPGLHQHVKALGVQRWQVQLAHATGRQAAADMLSPAQNRALAAFLVEAARDPVLPPAVHETIGWLSRDEPILRSSGRSRAQVWLGSPCGRSVLAIEPDGGVKGCPNQVGAPFVVGQVREEPLARIWQDRARWFWLNPPPSQAAGPCAPCALQTVCGGGCPCVAWATTGALYNNPLCLRAAS